MTGTVRLPHRSLIIALWECLFRRQVQGTRGVPSSHRRRAGPAGTYGSDFVYQPEVQQEVHCTKLELSAA